MEKECASINLIFLAQLFQQGVTSVESQDGHLRAEIELHQQLQQVQFVVRRGERSRIVVYHERGSPQVRGSLAALIEKEFAAVDHLRGRPGVQGVLGEEVGGRVFARDREVHVRIRHDDVGVARGQTFVGKALQHVAQFVQARHLAHFGTTFHVAVVI